MATQQEFIDAVKAGEVEAVRRMLAHNPSLLASRDASGVSALLTALYNRQLAISKLLLSKRPTMNIFEAAAYGRTTRAEDLLRQDPSLAQAWSVDGFTALHLACFFGHADTAALLLRHGADPSVHARNQMQVAPLHSAAAARSLETVRLLLDHGAEVNARQQGGWTALHAAAQHGDVEMAKLLIERGAEVTAANDEGVTAADLAREGGHTVVTEMIAAQ
jgi:ankyrin repeat protein